MGTDLRVDKNFEKAKGQVPGPGNYNIKSAAFQYDRPRFHMGIKHNVDPIQKEIQSVPGPGAHDPKISYSKTSAPGYSLKSRSQSQQPESHKTPGPGNYQQTATHMKG